MGVVLAVLISNHNPLIIGISPVQVTRSVINGQILNTVRHTLKQIRLRLILSHIMLANFLGAVIGPINSAIFVIGGKGPVL